MIKLIQVWPALIIYLPTLYFKVLCYCFNIIVPGIKTSTKVSIDRRSSGIYKNRRGQKTSSF